MNNLITIGIALVLGVIVYKAVSVKEEKSKFSSACGCGK